MAISPKDYNRQAIELQNRLNAALPNMGVQVRLASADTNLDKFFSLNYFQIVFTFVSGIKLFTASEMISRQELEMASNLDSLVSSLASHAAHKLGEAISGLKVK